MVSLYQFPVIFIDTNFQKGHPNQNGGCPDTLYIRATGRFPGVVLEIMLLISTTLNLYDDDDDDDKAIK